MNPKNQQQFVQDFLDVMQKITSDFEGVDLSAIDKRKKELDLRRPLPQGALKSLEQKLRVGADLTYPHPLN